MESIVLTMESIVLTMEPGATKILTMVSNVKGVYWIDKDGDVVYTLPPQKNDYEYYTIRDYDWTTCDCDVRLLYKEREAAYYDSKLQHLYIYFKEGDGWARYHLGANDRDK